MTKQRYRVVVESGSCSPDYRRWEERATCGHAHKSIELAVRCLRRLTRCYCEHGHVQGTPCARCLGGIARSNSTSARWYNATLHTTDGARLSEEQAQEMHEYLR